MPLLKKIRKWLRRRKGWLAMGSMLLTLTALALALATADKEHFPTRLEQTQDGEAVHVLAEQPVILVLETNYLCGTQTEIKEFENDRALQAWVDAQNTPWQLKEKNEDTYVMVHEVSDDLAPVCKEEGYFGISDEGILTIYQGPPTDNQVIQTFFRIDTQRLESKLPKNEIGTLQEGIRIRDVADYMYVLSMYEEFAIGF